MHLLTTHQPSTRVPTPVSRELDLLCDESLDDRIVQNTTPGTYARQIAMKAFISRANPEIVTWFDAWVRDLRSMPSRFAQPSDLQLIS